MSGAGLWGNSVYLTLGETENFFYTFPCRLHTPLTAQPAHSHCSASYRDPTKIRRDHVTSGLAAARDLRGLFISSAQYTVRNATTDLTTSTVFSSAEPEGLQ